jgi:HlyD family secretion protein
MSKKKLLLFAFVALIIVAALVVALRFRGRGPQATRVETAPVERMELVQTVSATGRIQPKTQVNISADVSAKITRLPVAEGDWVDEGTLLVELERERYLAAVESAEANLRVAQANADVTRENLVKAEKDFARIKELYDRELETQAQLDAMHAAFQAERARNQSAVDQVAQVRAALKQIRDDLSKTTIYTPMSGTISKLNKEVGEIALGSQFQEDVIMIVSNLSGMEALVDVDENDIVSVAVADAATIEVDALPDVALDGRVTDIANSANVSAAGTSNQKTEFEVKVAVLEPHLALRPGMTASCEIVTDTRDAALAVPIQSVAVRTPEQLGQTEPASDDGEESEAADGWVPDKDGFVEIVFVVEDGVAEARQVTTGIQSETHIEIVDGLEEGAQVVIGSYRAISRELSHGAPVTVGNGSTESHSEDSN